MGIKGLVGALARLPVGQSRVPLRRKRLVIDGPALVFRLWEALMMRQQAAGALLGQVSHAKLARVVIDWLDDLRNHDVHVNKIYFDGYLPPFKWETRKTRLMNQTQTVQELVKEFRKGVGLPMPTSQLTGEGFQSAGFSPDSGAGAEPGRPLSMKSSVSAKAYADSLPKHPFTVPAVIESLRQSHWADAVQVVPGEADAYCAQDVYQNGGLLLTADSDLLLQDLGVSGAVVFFWDLFGSPVKPGDGILDPASANDYYVATKHSSTLVEQHLAIGEHGGLLRLVFEWQQRGGSLLEAQGRIHKDGPETAAADKPAWEAFLDEHRLVEYVPDAHPVLGLLSGLDPRISEFVIQSLDLKVSGQRRASELTAKSTQRAPRGSEQLSIFLPVMIEDPSQKSCWEHSQVTRQLAYRLAQGLDQAQREIVIEYRTLFSVNGGREVEIPDASTADAWCESLISTLSFLEPAEPSKVPCAKWFTFALYQEIQLARESSIKSSLTIKCATQAVYNTQPREYSWENIHLSAVIQASFYSLRLLKQVLSVRASLTPEQMTDSQKKLLLQLETLPPITEWPGVLSLRDDLREFANGNGLDDISRVLRIHPMKLKDPSAGKKKIRQPSSKIDKRKAPTKLAKSANAFAALEMAMDS
ncbi:hypothetical protein LQW54_010707 [Pestalotiopsis sp. IQ-011]